MVKKRNRSARSGALLGFAVLLLGLVFFNLIGDYFYKRFDLTKEKRFTLSNSTIELAEKVDDVLYFQIFLDGDFPKEYQRLKNATRDMLDEFRHATNGNLEYRFENTLEDKETKEKEEILRELHQKGLLITKPEIKDDEAIADKYIIPAGLVFYQNTEYPINLLKTEFGKSLEMNINNSIELLEYEIGNIIRKCVQEKKLKLAFAEGHNELNYIETADITKELSTFYDVERINLNINDTACVNPFLDKIMKDTANAGSIFYNSLMDKLNSYDALIVAKPRLYFLEEELFLIDQFIMNGGKVIWLVETLNAEMDSVGKYGTIMTADYNLNLSNTLFRYGFRVNPTIIQDIQCHGIPVIAQQAGNAPGFKKWYFYPLFNPVGDHPITKNVSPVWSRFAASIDTLPNKNLKKTILLQSSQYSRVASNPVQISLNALSLPPDPDLFNKPNQIAGVLVEGSFKSVFAHRKGVREKIPIPYKTESGKNQMIVLSDGDLIANQYIKRTKEILPLGYDKHASKFTGQQVQFANTKFFLNCVDYLVDESNLIEVRNKKIEIRLLNRAKVKKEKLKWQMINMVLPILLIILFGVANMFYRKRKYSF